MRPAAEMDGARALFVLTPSESKRLIGKAVAAMPAIRRALETGNILIGHGSTNVYVAEEILGREHVAALFDRDVYMSGVTVRGTLCNTLGQEKPPLLLLRRGTVEPPGATMADMLRHFGRDSVFIKGANAIDPEGNAAVFMAHPEGGTIGWSFGMIRARGIQLVVPVGLEKLVPSVSRAVSLCGQQTLDYAQGLKVGLLPLAGGTVVTEIEALRILAGVESWHVASGGCSGSEGAVAVVSEGSRAAVEQAIGLVESVKGEPALTPRKGICATCAPTSPAQPRGYEMPASEKRCLFERRSEEGLPGYLKGR